ncbi:MAG: hypothetical protein V7K40_02360 [Nostoc sp.]|uniref:hypothetical protein n=1 Tax=Nostoc sp. TaxID=1180 RepID=UPI002FFC08A8
MVADQTGEVCKPVNLYFILVVGFEIPVTRLMKADHNRHDLALTQTAISYAGRLRHCAFFFAAHYQQLALPLWFKGLTEVIDTTE